MNLKQWRQKRAADEYVAKALRHAGRLSTSEMLDTSEQAVYSIAQSISVLRTTTDPDYRFQLLAEAVANADLVSVLLGEVTARQELSIARSKKVP